jgi:hypothetical protein
MKHHLLAALGLLGCTALCSAVEFEKPVRLKAGGVPIRVEAPGYACPCLADLDGKGRMDLLVGQFSGGKIQLFKGLAGGQFAKGSWLLAGGKPAEVPGVW